MREKYLEYLKGKSVAIVGPAPSLFDTPNNKEIIESKDVIIRINKSLPIPANIQEISGKRTDILYNCLNADPESGGHLHISYLQKKIKWLVCPYPDIYPFSLDISKFKEWNSNRIPFTLFDKQRYEEIVREINTRPNSGVLTILDMLSSEIDNLYITGITFFRGGYIPEYREYSEEQVLNRMAVHGNHRQEPQIEFMKQVLKNDNRVIMDSALKEIVYE